MDQCTVRELFTYLLYLDSFLTQLVSPVGPFGSLCSDYSVMVGSRPVLSWTTVSRTMTIMSVGPPHTGPTSVSL